MNNMKIKNLIFALFLGIALVSCTGNKGPKDGFTAPKAEVDSVSYLLGVNFGNFIKTYDFGSDLNYGQIVKGIKDMVSAKGTPGEEEYESHFRISPEEIDAVFNGYLGKRAEYQIEANKVAGAAFLEENKNKPGVCTTESGLQYEIINEGNDVKPTADDIVTVRYVGTLLDGTVFDQCKPEDNPATFPLSGVIAGWTEGVQLIGEGGKIKLYIPSDLAYGENGAGIIGPNSTIIFDVDLISVTRAEEDAE